MTRAVTPERGRTAHQDLFSKTGHKGSKSSLHCHVWPSMFDSLSENKKTMPEKRVVHRNERSPFQEKKIFFGDDPY